jgi:hypothetical protein
MDEVGRDLVQLHQGALLVAMDLVEEHRAGPVIDLSGLVHAAVRQPVGIRDVLGEIDEGSRSQEEAADGRNRGPAQQKAHEVAAILARSGTDASLARKKPPDAGKERRQKSEQEAGRAALFRPVFFRHLEGTHGAAGTGGMGRRAGACPISFSYCHIVKSYV